MPVVHRRSCRAPGPAASKGGRCPTPAPSKDVPGRTARMLLGVELPERVRAWRRAGRQPLTAPRPRRKDGRAMSPITGPVSPVTRSESVLTEPVSRSRGRSPSSRNRSPGHAACPRGRRPRRRRPPRHRRSARRTVQGRPAAPGTRRDPALGRVHLTRLPPAGAGAALPRRVAVRRAPRPGRLPGDRLPFAPTAAEALGEGAARARSDPAAAIPGLGEAEPSGTRVAGVLPQSVTALLPTGVTCFRRLPTGPGTHDALATVFVPAAAKESAHYGEFLRMPRAQPGPVLRTAAGSRSRPSPPPVSTPGRESPTVR